MKARMGTSMRSNLRPVTGSIDILAGDGDRGEDIDKDKDEVEVEVEALTDEVLGC